MLPAVVRGEVVEPALVGEDDQRDIGVAEHGELARLLGQAAQPLREGHLPAHAVLDPPHLHLAAPPPHLRLPCRPAGDRIQSWLAGAIGRRA